MKLIRKIIFRVTCWLGAHRISETITFSDHIEATCLHCGATFQCHWRGTWRKKGAGR